jgi:mono/diheme cytochrome c family protein
MSGLQRADFKKILACFLVLVGGVLTVVYRQHFLRAPASPPLSELLYLNNDVWTEAERQRYYHLSQGSQLMPYDWFVALEQGDNAEPFISDEHMSTFRFIPDPNLLSNPDRLPIGIAKDDPDPVTGVVNVGITCAACHTAQIAYKGVGIRIDGGPGLANLDGFLENVLVSLGVTVISESSAKFERFARKVLKDNYNKENSKQLFRDVRNYLEQELKLKLEEKASDTARGLRRTESGFGRLDGLGTGGNRLYRLLGTQNLRTLNAPVKALPLWHTHDYNWLQTNGSMRQPLARNVIQALTVNSSLVFPGDPAKNDRYISSVRLKNIVEMEQTTQRFKPPVWPEKVLGPINQEAAARGEAIYQKQCAYCHEPQKENQPQAGDATATRNNKTYFVLRMFAADKIKTDPNDALNFAERTVDASSIQMGNTVPGPDIISMVLSGVINRQFNDLNLSVEQREEWSGYRDNLLRICKGYAARPLAGVWACAPYLHNGSVHSLYQLLLPPAERDKVFFTGDFEFDPVNVGFVSTGERGGFKFDTSISGNSNAGHQFGTSLKHEERMDLIEYLKVLKFPAGDYQLATAAAQCE